MSRRAKIDWRMGVRLLGALSLILVAFAHQPLDLRGYSLPDASAYAFPDGSIPVICVTLSDDRGGSHVTHAMPCDACLVAGSILVPAPAEIPGPTLALAYSTAAAPTVPLIARAAFSPSAPPHAPPLA